MILNPGDIAIDYVAKKDPAAVAAAGVRLCVRYISPTRSNPKNLTPAERDALLAGGLSVALVWENATTDPLAGRARGLAHGAIAGQFARDLGYPSWFEIIVAVDFNVTAAQLPVVLDYLAGFKETSGYAQGTYGKDIVITAAHDAGLSTLGWQTVAWSGGRISPHADVIQHAHNVHPSILALGSVDDNTVLRTFRAWSTVQDPPPEEPAMLASNQEARQMPWGLSAPGAEIFLIGTRKRSVSPEEYKDLYANGPAAPLTNATLDSIPDEVGEAAAPTIDYGQLATMIAKLVVIPTHITGTLS